MSTFSAIVTSHANPRGLRHILGQLMYQTRKPDEILVFASDTPDMARILEDFPSVSFFTALNRDDWGHEKRCSGLWVASGDFCGFFNDDDRYSNDYIEKMMNHATNMDVVYCQWSGSPDCGFSMGSSTSGNFIFRTALGRELGYTDRVYEADGLFINKFQGRAERIAKVDEVLYFHNQGLRTDG